MIRTDLLLFALLLLGCYGSRIIVNGHEVRSDRWAEAEERVRERAAFDFECAPDGLTLQLIGSHGGWPDQVGVTGCSRRGVYVRIPNSFTWVTDQVASGHGAPSRRTTQQPQSQIRPYAPTR